MQLRFRMFTLTIVAWILCTSLPSSTAQDSDNDACKRYAQAVVDMHDMDKDGRLSRREMRVLHRLLKDIDNNGDAFVDVSELVQSVVRYKSLEAEKRQRDKEKPDERLTQHSDRDVSILHAEKLLAVCDEDKDGRLSKSELKQMLNPPTEADTNRDGFVDKSELIEKVMGGLKANSELQALSRKRVEEKQPQLEAQKNKQLESQNKK